MTSLTASELSREEDTDIPNLVDALKILEESVDMVVIEEEKQKTIDGLGLKKLPKFQGCIFG